MNDIIFKKLMILIRLNFIILLVNINILCPMIGVVEEYKFFLKFDAFCFACVGGGLN